MSTNLNLIPGSSGGEDFRSKLYWDKFFKTRGSKAFEWYGEYETLCGVLHKYIKRTDNVLMIGCGNSTLSERMYDVGIPGIVNIDLSAVVIQQMQAKNRARKEMEWIKMDMLDMQFDDGRFDACVDKGTLDALMSGDPNEKVNEDADRLFNEVDRVLKVGGRYVCISLAQDHILDKLLRSFKDKNWIIRVHRIEEQDLDFFLPVFVFVFTKMKIKMPNSIIEMKLEPEDEKFLRVESLEEAKSRIKEYQNYGLTKFYISNKTVDIKDDVFVYLYDSSSQKYPRFTIYIVDTPGNMNKARMNGIFAVFVVPLGKEMEWLFSTKKGREELTSQAKYQRLAIVHLNRAHTYGTLDSIIAELSPKVKDLAPKGIPNSYKIPLLSMGPEVDVRDLKFKGQSDMSGEFFVEDVTPSNASVPTRRLVFQSINPLIQTEAPLKIEKKGKKEKTTSPNYNSFLEDYISMVMAQLYSIKLDAGQHLDILIIGLGGGVLANYCKNWLKDSVVDAVEIDEKIANVAKDWFGLVEDKRTRIHIDDGIKFINDAAKSKEEKKWNIVMIDINSSDPNNDLWGPTKEFLEIEFLKNCKSVLNKDKGILILNLLCLNESLKSDIYKKLNSLWSNIYVNKLTKNRNEILFCTDQDAESLFLKNAFTPSEKRNINPNSTDGSSMNFLNDIYKSFNKLDLNKS